MIARLSRTYCHSLVLIFQEHGFLIPKIVKAMDFDINNEKDTTIN